MQVPHEYWPVSAYLVRLAGVKTHIVLFRTKGHETFDDILSIEFVGGGYSHSCCSPLCGRYDLLGNMQTILRVDNVLSIRELRE